MPPDPVLLIYEITVHVRAAIGAVRQRNGGAELRQIDHVLPLAVTGRAFLPGENPLWLTPGARHIGLSGKPAYSALMKANFTDFSPS